MWLPWLQVVMHKGTSGIRWAESTDPWFIPKVNKEKKSSTALTQEGTNFCHRFIEKSINVVLFWDSYGQN